MAKVGAQRAAELTGKSKSTIQRAMNAGKLSFEVDANQRRLVDVSELERVFGLQPQGTATRDTASVDSESVASVMEIELERARHAIEIERLKMEVRLAQEQADAAASQVEDLKIQRDLWQKQAQQILITSQYSQKQAEERINEMQMREEARKVHAETRRMQASAVNHEPQQRQQQQARPQQQQAAQQQRPAQQRPVQQPAAEQQRAAASEQRAQSERNAAIAAERERAAAEQRAAQAELLRNQSTAASDVQTPVFRTVQAGNQNRLSQSTGQPVGQKQSLFASLFGLKKTRRA